MSTMSTFTTIASVALAPPASASGVDAPGVPHGKRPTGVPGSMPPGVAAVSGAVATIAGVLSAPLTGVAQRKSVGVPAASGSDEESWATAYPPAVRMMAARARPSSIKRRYTYLLLFLRYLRDDRRADSPHDERRSFPCMQIACPSLQNAAAVMQQCETRREGGRDGVLSLPASFFHRGGEGVGVRSLPNAK